MSFSEAGNPWRKIYDRIGKAAALEQLAEECDELIRSIVGDENFVPFDISYGQAYMDEAKRIRVKEV